MQQISPLFTKEDIQKGYPSSEYGKKGRGLDCSLHFMMVLDQPLKNILNYIQQLNEKKPPSPRLTHRDDSFHKFSPLHLAVILGNGAIVSSLLASNGRGALDICDTNGWTPLHHAALRADALYQTLILQGADTKLITLYAANAEDLYSLCHHSHTSRSQLPCSVEIEEGKPKKIQDFTEAELQTHLGIKKWRDTLFIPAHQTKQLWKRPLEFNLDFLSSTTSYNFPRLRLKKCNGLWQVLAEAPIPAGTIISELAGELTPLKDYPKENFPESLKNWKQFNYKFEDIDSSDIGNIARFITFGFPNIKFVQKKIHGIDRFFAVALAPIGKNEPLFADYCIGHLEEAFGASTNWQRNVCRAFFAKELREHSAGYNHVLFPLNFPLALIDLHFSDLVSAAEWDKQLCRFDSQPFDEWQEKFSGGAQLIKCLLHNLRLFEDVFSDRPDYRALVAQWVLDKVDKLSVLHILKGIDMFTGFKTAVSGVFNQWNELEKKLNLHLEAYDPLSDTEGPLSFDRRFQIMLSWIRGPLQGSLLKSIKGTLDKSVEKDRESDRMGRAILKYFDYH